MQPHNNSNFLSWEAVLHTIGLEIGTRCRPATLRALLADLSAQPCVALAWVAQGLRDVQRQRDDPQ